MSTTPTPDDPAAMLPEARVLAEVAKDCRAWAASEGRMASINRTLYPDKVRRHVITQRALMREAAWCESEIVRLARHDEPAPDTTPTDPARAGTTEGA